MELLGIRKVQFGLAASGYPQINFIKDDGANLFWLMDSRSVRCWDASAGKMVVEVKPGS